MPYLHLAVENARELMSISVREINGTRTNETLC